MEEDRSEEEEERLFKANAGKALQTGASRVGKGVVCVSGALWG